MPDSSQVFEYEPDTTQDASEPAKAPEVAPNAEAPSQAPADPLEEEDELVTDEMPSGFNPNAYMPSPAGPPPHPRTV